MATMQNAKKKAKPISAFMIDDSALTKYKVYAFISSLSADGHYIA